MSTKLLHCSGERLTALRRERETISSIVRTMCVDNISTRATVHQWIFHWSENNDLNDDNHTPRPLKITDEMVVYMDEVGICAILVLRSAM